MEELNRNIDHLFAKAKTAKVGMSIEQIKMGIAVFTVAGATAATGLITKLKIVSIMIASGLAVTATVILLSSNNTGTNETVVPIIENEKTVQFEPKINLDNEEQRLIAVFDNEREVEIIENVEKTAIVAPVFVPEVPELAIPSPQPFDKKEVGDFHSIVVQIDCDVELFKGDKCATDVLQSELTDVIDFNISNGVLTVGIKEGRDKDFWRVAKNRIVEIELTMKNIKAIQVQGQAVVHSDDDIPSTDLSVTVQGSGDVTLQAIAPKSYTIALSGSGDIALKGKGNASKGTIQISGSGDVCIPNIEADDVNVQISGSGDVNVFAKGKLDVKIAGSGDVSYSGDPETSVAISGSGDVHKGCNN